MLKYVFKINRIYESYKKVMLSNAFKLILSTYFVNVFLYFCKTKGRYDTI